MLKKIIIIAALICSLIIIDSCTSKYYNILNSDGDIVSIDISDLSRSEKRVLKQYQKGDIDIFDVISSGYFTAEELAQLGLIGVDDFTGEPVLDGGVFTGLPYVDPDIIIKVISGNATQADLQALFDAGMTEEDIAMLLPRDTDKTQDEYGRDLPPSE